MDPRVLDDLISDMEAAWGAPIPPRGSALYQRALRDLDPSCCRRALDQIMLEDRESRPPPGVLRERALSLMAREGARRTEPPHRAPVPGSTNKNPVPPPPRETPREGAEFPAAAFMAGTNKNPVPPPPRETPREGSGYSQIPTGPRQSESSREPTPARGGPGHPGTSDSQVSLNWYLEVLRKYAVFEGRARRMELWVFALVNVLVMTSLVVTEQLTGFYDPDSGYGYLSGIYLLATLLPGLAVAVRRLHDTGRSGLWLLIAFIPVVGGVVLIVFYATDGDSGENEYGPDPKLGPEPRGSQVSR